MLRVGEEQLVLRTQDIRFVLDRLPQIARDKPFKATFNNFSDYPLRSRLHNGGGKISTARAMKIINEYTVAFFDRELKGKFSSLLERQSGSTFPDVVFEYHAQPRSPTAHSDRGAE